MRNSIDLAEKRKIFPVDPRSFLYKTEPISRVFGLDRGTPIDRYYIEKFLSSDRVKTLKCEEAITFLEVSESTYSKRVAQEMKISVAQYNVLDYRTGEDLTNTDTLRKESCDVFICTQTFNFIYDVRKAIEGAYYTLKKEGLLLATVSGAITPISRYDMNRWGHFWGFTDLSAKMIFTDVFGDKNVDVIPYGNVLSATAFVQGVALEDFDDLTLLDERDEDYQVLIGITARKR